MRYLNYNETMKNIERMEKDESVFVIRPENALNIGRLENNPEKTQEIYDVGYQDGLGMVEKVKRIESIMYQASKERYNTMKYFFCGDSGLKLPAVSFGLWHNFGDDSD